MTFMELFFVFGLVVLLVLCCQGVWALSSPRTPIWRRLVVGVSVGLAVNGLFIWLIILDLERQARIHGW